MNLAKLGNTNTLKVDTIRSKVGINSTVPTGDLQVGAAITVGSASGIISQYSKHMVQPNISSIR